MKPTAFITGATSGIGKATAEIFAKNNIRLILCGRRADRLESLQQELGKLTDVTTLQFDVSKRNEVENAIKSLSENFKKIDILINNARNNGFIVNIGSIAGKEVYPNGNVYCASKHAVNALNKAMRVDLNKHSIRVSAIHPGAVETAFSEVRFKGDLEKSKSVYTGYKALQAEDIADIIHFVITRPYHVNIEDLVVYSTAQASPTILNKK